MIAGLSLFSQAHAIHISSAHWQTMVFTVLTLSQMANVMAARSEVESCWSLGLFSNLPLLGAVTLDLPLVTFSRQCLPSYLLDTTLVQA